MKAVAGVFEILFRKRDFPVAFDGDRCKILGKFAGWIIRIECFATLCYPFHSANDEIVRAPRSVP